MAAKMADEFLERVDVAREFREFKIARGASVPRCALLSLSLARYLLLARIPVRNAEVVAYIESDVSVVAGPLTLLHGCGDKAPVTVASRKGRTRRSPAERLRCLGDDSTRRDGAQMRLRLYTVDFFITRVCAGVPARTYV